MEPLWAIALVGVFAAVWLGVTLFMLAVLHGASIAERRRQYDREEVHQNLPSE